jgi:uncharacterized delta-60 repeat protein
MSKEWAFARIHILFPFLLFVISFFVTFRGVDSSCFAQSGNLNFSFNPGTGANGDVRIIAVQNDGKIIIGGEFTSFNGTTVNRIARLNPDGSLDNTFSIGTGANSSVQAIAIQDDGKILIGGGFTSFNGTTINRIARLNPNGSLDLEFSPGAGADNLVRSILLLDNGKFIITGDFINYNGTSRNRIARINLNGSLDLDFSPGSGANNTIITASSLPDGKLLIGGNFTSFMGTAINRVARLNSNGTLDSSFNPGTGADGEVIVILIQNDSKIILVGTFTNFNGATRNRIVRLNTDGSIDNTFTSTGTNWHLFTAALQKDGKIIIGGDITTYNGSSVIDIARINTDGSFDNTFNPGTGPVSTVFSIAIQKDGRILIGGSFTSYNGTSRNRIARIWGDMSGLEVTTKSPTGVINRCITGGGTVTWASPGNATTSNNLYAVSTFGTNNTSSCRLQSSGYNFAIPAGNIIDDIDVSVEWSTTNALIDSAIYLIKNGNALGNNSATGAALPGATDEITTYGLSNLWGTSFTPSDINDNTFGAAVVVRRTGAGGGRDARIDHIPIRVYHHTPAPMTYVSSSVSQITSQVFPNSQNNHLIKIAVETEGEIPINVSSFVLNMNGTTNLTDVENAKIYYTGNNPAFNTTNQLGNTITSPSYADFSITGFSQPLLSGSNYFWLAVDIMPNATVGNFVDAECRSITVDGVTRIPSPTAPAGSRQIASPVVFSVCATGCDYTTIQSAYNAIPSTPSSQYIIEVRNGYNSASETFPISFGNKNNMHNIIVRPHSAASSLVCAGSLSSNAIWILDGAQNIIIDGRSGGTGSTKQFTIRNTRNASPYGTAFLVRNDALNINFLHLIVEAETTAGSGLDGIISIGSTTGTTGNESILISNCLLRDLTVGGSGVVPFTGVFSSGTAGKSNKSIKIDDNKFSDGGFPAINMASNTTDVEISNNHIFHTSSLNIGSTAGQYININSGSNHIIRNNFLGGTSVNCGGSAFNISGSGIVTAIAINASGSNIIENNTIANFNYTTTTTTANYPLQAIRVEGSGNFTVGSSGNGNLIGSTSGTNNITLTNNATSGSRGFSAIHNLATGTVNIRHNSIGGITVNGTRAGASSDLIVSNAGLTVVEFNTIGNASANNLSFTTNSNLSAILNTQASTQGITIRNNTIRNVNYGATNQYLLLINNAAGPLVCNNNIIDSITAGGEQINAIVQHGGTNTTTAQINGNALSNISFTGTGTSAAAHIILTNTTGNVEVNNNIIGLTNKTITISGNNISSAIYKAGTGSLTCNNNTIQEFNLTNSGTGAQFIGIYYKAGTFSAKNNTIINIDNFNSNIYGIFIEPSSAGTEVIKNTIRNLNLTNTGASSAEVNGIFALGNGKEISKNFIAGLTSQSSTSSSGLYGVYIISSGAWNVQNNVILLSNAPYSNSKYISGIYLFNDDVSPVKIYHNTIKISGNDPTGYSTCIENSSYLVGDIVKNNIFQNIRTGGGDHYAESDWDGLSITDYNYLEVANDQNKLGNYNGFDYDSNGWKTNVAPNSQNGTITLDADGKVTTDPFPGAGTGTNLTVTVPNDKLDVTRGIASWMGAFEGPNITTSAISPFNYCAGDAIGVSYTVGGGESFNGGNIFTAQLSNSAGDFSSPTNIGTLASTNSGTIAATIPGGISGTGFLIRVVSSSPQVSGSDNGANINIQTAAPSPPTANAASGISCSGFTANWTASAGAVNYFLDLATDAGFTSFLTGYNNLDIGNVTNHNVTGLIAGTTYYYRVRALNVCGTSVNSNSISATTSGTQQTYIVTSTANTGAGTLRQAILDANANCGHDTIKFNLGAAIPYTIALTAALPNLTDPAGVTINGFDNGANPGTPNSIPVFDATTATPMNPTYAVILGNNNNIPTGLVISSGSNNNVIKGLVLQDFGDGTPSTNDIAITVSGNNNKILGCYIGMGATGTTRGTKTADGIVITGANNMIGDGTAAGANLISGLNGGFEGILINGAAATGNTVKGNIIGLQKDGSSLVASAIQRFGIAIDNDSYSNTIGGSNPGEGNVISGNKSNTLEGIGLYLGTGGSNVILGNIIGPQADGITYVASNEQKRGIQVQNSPSNIIGGNMIGERNIISANESVGINFNGVGSIGNVVKGNYIGTDINGTNIIVGSTQNYGVGFNGDGGTNVIGGTNVGDGNVISGNNDGVNSGKGIYFNNSLSVGNSVIGNIIGLQKDGTTYMANNLQYRGIEINGSTNCAIGGNTAAHRNIISANEQYGIIISGSGSTGNAVKGNYIGIDATGTSFVTGSTQDYGVYITSSAASNTIGGSGAGEGNVISGNKQSSSFGIGIEINSNADAGNNIIGNIIGPQADGITYLASNAQFRGIEIFGSKNNTIGGNSSQERNIISANETYGIVIESAGSSGNIIKGNFIGINKTGTEIIVNSTQDFGIFIASNSPGNNTIGGTGTGEGNVISGNSNGGTLGRGVFTNSTATAGNTILGNIIGPQADGVTYLADNAQFRGIEIANSANNTIGGNTAGAKNIISANEQYGVFITGAGATGNVVKGNYIGIDATGTSFITGSTQDYGVSITSSAASNTIGGSGAGEGNVISGNSNGALLGTGIYIASSASAGNTVVGNIIGAQANGTANLAYNAQYRGVGIYGSPNNIIGGSSSGARNVVSANRETGIYLTGANSTGNIIQGNYIGTDITGTSFIVSQGNGVVLLFSSATNIIGGSNIGEGNVISGNKWGVAIGSTGGNSILGNIIGPQADGISYISLNIQDYGISISGANNTIGGNSPGAKNIISANEIAGVRLNTSNSVGNTITGNYIGPSSSLASIIGSNQGYGVYVVSSAANNTIGTTDAGVANHIAFNTADGVHLIDTSTIENKIRRNLIYENPKAINLNYGASQANIGIPKPVIVSYTETEITGTSQPNDTIEIFKNTSGTAQYANTYIATVVANASGDWNYSGSFTVGEYILATATDVNNNTSEFSDLAAILLSGNDVGITELISPFNLECATINKTVVVRLKNFDTNAIDFSSENVNIHASVAGPNSFSFAPIILNSGTLAAGATMDVTISASFDMSASGTYTFDAYTDLTGDTDNTNDAMPSANVSVPANGGPGTWTWTGNEDNIWFNPCNWDNKSLPDILSDVIIPGGTANDPEIGLGDRFPEVAATASSTSGGATSSHSVNLPAGIQNGDLLMIFWADNNSTATVTTPTGWNILYSTTVGAHVFAAWYKTADGTETSPITVTTSANVKSAHTAYRVAAGTYQGISDYTFNTGNDNQPDPPPVSLVLGPGTEKILWLSAIHTQGVPTITPPAEYNNFIQVTTSGAPVNSNAKMFSAIRLFESASEDPGVFNMSAPGNWTAATIAVRGVSVSATCKTLTIDADSGGILNINGVSGGNIQVDQ